MKYIALLILGLSLLACGQVKTARVDPAFVFFVNEFEHHYGRKLFRIDEIRFDELDNRRAGQCEGYDDGYRIISINSKYWDGFNVNYKRILIFHELAHCELDRDHTDGKSIMRPVMFYVNFDDPRERNYYMRELFERIYE